MVKFNLLPVLQEHQMQVVLTFNYDKPYQTLSGILVTRCLPDTM